MSVVIVFDRDGTVTTGGGVIPVELIKELVRRGFIVYAYGNPTLSSEANIPYARGGDKVSRLRWVKTKHPYAKAYYVIDDIPINVEGWKYLSPKGGLELIKKLLQL